MSEDIIEQANNLAEEAKAPGVFSILNVLKERAYPKEQVNVYLDEQSAYDASLVQEKIDELLKSADVGNQDAIDDLSAKRDALLGNLEKSKYTFFVTGLSEGLRSDIYDQASEKFPIEYDESKNPFTGEVVKSEIDNKERDRYFTNLLWHSSIEKIVAPDGAVQESVTMEDIVKLRELLPLAGIGAVTQSIEKLRTATAIFMLTVDEDFLAKS